MSNARVRTMLLIEGELEDVEREMEFYLDGEWVYWEDTVFDSVSNTHRGIVLLEPSSAVEALDEKGT